MKRIIAFTLAMLCLLSVVSCADTSKNEDQAEVKIERILIENGASQYAVVMPKEDNYGETLRTMEIFNALGGHDIAGLQFVNEKLVEDKADTCAILVGSTCFGISAKAAAMLTSPKDYVIYIENNQIAIYSEYAASLQAACTKFLSSIVVADGKSTLSIQEKLIENYAYPFASLKIDGVSIKNFVIVIPDGSDAAKAKAVSLNEWVIENVGVELPVKNGSDEPCEYEILIGNTGRDYDNVSATLSNNQYKMVSGNKKVFLAYNGYGLSIISDFIEKLEEADINSLSVEKSDSTYDIFRSDNFAAGKLSDELLDSVNPGVLALLSCCMYYESELQKGIKRGEKWVYSNSSTYVPQSGYFDDMVSSGKVGTNCSMPQAWAFIDMGIVTNGKHLYGNQSNGLSQWDNLGKYFACVATVTAWNGKYEWQALYKKGLVEPGDVFYAHGHTFIYMGDELFMAAGHDGKWHSDSSAPTEDGSHAVFETWVLPIKNCSDYGYSINFQLRLKDDYVPKYYRNAAGKLVQNPMYDASSSTMYKEGMKVDTSFIKGEFK